MPSLQISELQTSALSADLVWRHTQSLSRRADANMPAPGTVPSDLPPAAPRLKALHAALRSELPAKAGAAAPFVAADLDRCARQLLLALKAGATFREPAAAALMSSAATLGARWLSDERLYTRGLEADDEAEPDRGSSAQGTDHVRCEALPDHLEPAELKAWAERSWAAHYRQASRRNRDMRVQTQYALVHAMANEFSTQSLRTIADAVFRPDEIEGLTRFLREERSLLAAAGLDNRSLGDRRIEMLCIGADLVFGLGRFVRLAQVESARDQPAGPGTTSAGTAEPQVEQLNNHLREALNALAEQPR